MVIDDIRKTFEAVIGQLSPAKAQRLAKRYLEPGAAKEQVSKTAGELVHLSQRLGEAVRREVASQMRSMGVATRDDVDALRKRVRDLERAVGKTATSRRRATSAKTPARAKAGARAKTTAASARARASRKPSAAS
jgi:polyhydroxyalkanoate synthesis regulator phasin